MTNKKDKPQVINNGIGRWPRFIIALIFVLLTVIFWSNGNVLIGIIGAIISLAAIKWWIEGPEPIAVISNKDENITVIPRKKYIYVGESSTSEKKQKKNTTHKKVSSKTIDPDAISKVNILSNGNLSIFVGEKKIGSIVCDGNLKGWGDDFVVVQDKRIVTTYNINGDILGTLELRNGERVSKIHSDGFIVSDEYNYKTSYTKYC